MGEDIKDDHVAGIRGEPLQGPNVMPGQLLCPGLLPGLRQHFPNEKVSFAKMERELFDTTYEVIFTSSSKVEFLKNGDWKEVDCKYSTVPAAIIPQQIAQYVSQYYPDTSVVQIDRDKRDYEVKLTNGLELTFDLKFNLIDIDD